MFDHNADENVDHQMSEEISEIDSLNRDGDETTLNI
jgi:hypothetical protein